MFASLFALKAKKVMNTSVLLMTSLNLWVVQGFSPMNKYGLQTVMKLASCYGLKSSAQGSGKKQFVVVNSPRSCLCVNICRAYICVASLLTYHCIDQGVWQDPVTLLRFCSTHAAQH